MMKRKVKVLKEKSEGYFRKYHEEQGYFHEWGTLHGNSDCVYGIVEFDNGKCELFRMEHITFMEESSFLSRLCRKICYIFS